LIKKDVVTSRWGNKEIVTSPSYGVIKSIFIPSKTRIYEWEPLISIQTDEGKEMQISVGANGVIESFAVKVGDRVIPGSVLAYINEDKLVSGNH
jgi:pyruvate carboxylase